MSDLPEIVTIAGLTSTSIIGLIKNPEILRLVYGDLAQPSVRKVGEALSAVFDICNTILLPLKLVNEKCKARFENHMRRYKDKLMEVPSERINSVPSEIGIPIIEKLTYIEDSNLAELFINLLVRASDTAYCNYVHPQNIHILNMLTPEEALILKRFSETMSATKFPYIPCIKMIMKNHNSNGIRMLKNNTIQLRYLEGIKDINTDELYYNNFKSLGLIDILYNGGLLDSEEIYKEIEVNLSYLKKKYDERLNPKLQYVAFERGRFEITTLCKYFFKAVGLSVEEE